MPLVDIAEGFDAGTIDAVAKMEAAKAPDQSGSSESESGSSSSIITSLLSVAPDPVLALRHHLDDGHGQIDAHGVDIEEPKETEHYHSMARSKPRQPFCHRG